mgnify:CR=1 FL=1
MVAINIFYSSLTFQQKSSMMTSKRRMISHLWLTLQFLTRWGTLWTQSSTSVLCRRRTAEAWPKLSTGLTARLMLKPKFSSARSLLTCDNLTWSKGHHLIFFYFMSKTSLEWHNSSQASLEKSFPSSVSGQPLTRSCTSSNFLVISRMSKWELSSSISQASWRMI